MDVYSEVASNRMDSSEATIMEFRVTASGTAKLQAILEVGSRMSEAGNRNSGRAARKLEVGNFYSNL
jgi:hypothetical protein